jgi:hypothetical protein
VTPYSKPENTPEGRLAAVAAAVVTTPAAQAALSDGEQQQTLIALFRDAFRLFMQREALVVRIDEARQYPQAHVERMRVLDSQLRKINAELPEAFRI